MTNLFHRTLRAPVLALFFSLLFLRPGESTARGQGDWADLFNGKDIQGWKERGGAARFKIDGDSIVGTSVLNTGNSFLCTEKTYGDFIFEYEFKVDSRLNSGVQIRSECFDEPKSLEWQGEKIQIPAGRVHGYQIEIDPNVSRGRLWSGGIFDEGRRGWLFPKGGVDGPQGKAFSAQGLRIFKPEDWNRVRVEAMGDSIKTWLNGTPCADIHDGLTPRGFIALQVHGIRDDKNREDLEVRWRNLRIREVIAGSDVTLNRLTVSEVAAGWRLLWNGKTTDGWIGVKNGLFPEQCWGINEGVLTVHPDGAGEASGGGSIITRERFSNFELVADFKLTPGANSGIKYFVQSTLDADSNPSAGSGIGCEFQILDDQLHPDAKLGRDGNRTQGSLYDLIPANGAKKSNPVGDWNTARIVVNGSHVEHWLNGGKVLEYERGSAAFRATVAQSKFKNSPRFGEWPNGHILLQEHGDRVHFRNVKIRPLPPG